MRNPALLPAVIDRVNRSSLRIWTTLALTLGLLPLRSLATTVMAPNFDSLVSQADYVVRAVVKSVTAEWRIDGANRHIITKVELTVNEVIKGTPPSPLVLTMLGGRIGQDEMRVEGAPKFNVGDENILFVHGNGQQFIPLVALRYGQYQVARDPASAEAFVLRSNGSPLYDVSDVASPMSPAKAAAAARPLTVTEFATKIRASVATHQAQPPANAN
jgi:hypothetical protein